jgi:hypothetical protein
MKDIFSESNELLHNVNIRLYQSHLPGYEKQYHARTVNDTIMSIEDVCSTIIKNRGYKGDYKELVDNVKRYMYEIVYQLCSGNAINAGYFAFYPNVGGLFKNELDQPDVTSNPFSVRFHPFKPLREAIKSVRMVNQGLANPGGHIAVFFDSSESVSNSIFVPGKGFILTGSKIKITDEDPNCGLFFVSVDDPTMETRVSEIIKNSPTEIIGISPDVDYDCRLEIRTRFSNSSTTLKNIRCIKSKFIIQSA